MLCLGVGFLQFIYLFFFFFVIGTGFSVLLENLPVVFSSSDKNVPRENNNLFIEK
jgi:hypothetical protein